MGDPDTVVTEPGDIAEVDEVTELDGDANRRGRGFIAALLLLLLLLCSISTVVDTYVRHGERTVQRVTQNLECLQCHREMIPLMSWPTVHQPFGAGYCTGCHTPHGELVKLTIVERAAASFNRVLTLVEWLPLKLVLDVFDTGSGAPGEQPPEEVKRVVSGQVKGEDSTLVLPRTELCWMCHGDMGPMLGWEYRHEPFRTGKCLSCHNPHATQTGTLLLAEPRTLCMLCHNMGEELARDQVHPPAGERQCLSCHGPHATRHKGMIVERQRDLCFGCHSRVAGLAMRSVQHQPFLNGTCTECHEPHGSDHMQLLVERQPSLCYTCHPDTRLDFLKPSHHPVGTVKLTCSDCHDPHAADNRVLLAATDNRVCYRCHDKQPDRAVFESSLHDRVLCIGCHTPHGSNWGPLLQQRNPELCLRCHAPIYFDEEAGNNHPMRPYHFDMAKREPLTCTSTCHNPHGTNLDKMLRKYRLAKDGQCLQCHALVPGKRVGVDF